MQGSIENLDVRLDGRSTLSLEVGNHKLLELTTSFDDRGNLRLYEL